MNRRRHAVLFVLLGLLARTSFAQALLDGSPDQPLTHVAPGTTVQLSAHLLNLTNQTIFLRGLSYTGSETFSGTVSISDFIEDAPDSLQPGDSWAGVMAVIGVPAGPGTSSGHRLDFFVNGGVNRYDDQVVAQLTFAVDDSNVTTGAGDAPPLPRELALSAAPNPASGSTHIRLALPTPGRVELRLFDVVGRTRRVFVSGWAEAGERHFVWDGRDGDGKSLPAGAYFLRLETAQGARRLKLSLVR